MVKTQYARQRVFGKAVASCRFGLVGRKLMNRWWRHGERDWIFGALEWSCRAFPGGSFDYLAVEGVPEVCGPLCGPILFCLWFRGARGGLCGAIAVGNRRGGSGLSHPGCPFAGRSRGVRLLWFLSAAGEICSMLTLRWFRPALC